MTLLTGQPAVLPSTGPPRVRFELVRFHHTMLDGRWWPRSSDPAAELPGLVSLLERVRGPVRRVLLSAAGWATRPHRIVVAGRDISLGYFSDQSPATLTAVCVDGRAVALLVMSGPPQSPPVSAMSVNEPNSLEGVEDQWEGEGGRPAAHRRGPIR